MTEEDEALSAEVGVGPVVAVKLLASPVAHLTGGEQGRQRGPDSIYIVEYCDCLIRLTFCVETRESGGKLSTELLSPRYNKQNSNLCHLGYFRKAKTGSNS